jgi:hypothetical protein
MAANHSLVLNNQKKRRVQSTQRYFIVFLTEHLFSIRIMFRLIVDLYLSVTFAGGRHRAGERSAAGADGRGVAGHCAGGARGRAGRSGSDRSGQGDGRLGVDQCMHFATLCYSCFRLLSI